MSDLKSRLRSLLPDRLSAPVVDLLMGALATGGNETLEFGSESCAPTSVQAWAERHDVGQELVARILAEVHRTELPELPERYVHRGILGSGGMGTVYRVLDTRLGRSLALKVLLPQHGARFAERFTQEARVLAQLAHPGIVPVHDLGTLPDGQLFVTMKEVVGRTLGEAIHELHSGDAAMGLHQLVAVFGRVCAAVGFAHHHGLVHCDLKPANVMLGAHGEVRVVDWGLARPSSETAASGQWGTPGYAAPEMTGSSFIDPRTDVFALGGVLQCVLSGRHPTEGDVLQGLVLPEELKALCARARAVEPDERPADASAMAEAVAQWQDGRMRRERAHSQVARARARAQDAEALRGRARAQRAVADGRLFDASVPDPAAWDLLQSARDLDDQAGRSEEQVEVDLHGALLYDPDLCEAHRGLAQIHAQQAHLAAIDRRPQDARRASRRARQHLDFLGDADPVRAALERSLGAAGEEGRLQQVRFVGRTAEVDQLRAALGPGKVVTLAGTGGVGKTRLARQMALDGQQAALFVGLRSASDASDLARLVGRALGALQQVDIARVGRMLAARGHLLLVLDNFEQMAPAAAQAIGGWIKEAPELQVLVTSRRALGVPQEQVLQLGPLPPSAALRLFESVARRHRGGFTLHAGNLGLVRGMLEQLDRLPLAVELAAARVGQLDLPALAARLGLALLSDGIRSERNRALSDTIRWSWDLLRPWERAALAQCSVFRDGFSVQAADGVVDLSAWPEAPPPFDVLGALCDDHLLGRTDAGQIRYSMLASIAAFAGEQLTGEEALGAARRHAEWFALQEGCWQAPHDRGRERANLRAALTRATEHGWWDAALANTRSWARVVQLEGPFSQGAEVAAGVLSAVPPGYSVASLHLLVARILHLAGSLEDAEQRYRRWREDEGVSPTMRTTATSRLAMVRLARGATDEANVLLHAALAAARAANELAGQGVVLGNLGIVEKRAGRMDRARQHLVEALKLHRAADNVSGEAGVLGNLGDLQRLRGRLAEASEALSGSLALQRQLGNRRGTAAALCNLGTVELERGHSGLAARWYGEALLEARACGSQLEEVRTHLCIGSLATGEGDHARARDAYASSLRVAEAAGLRHLEGYSMVNLAHSHLHSGERGASAGMAQGALTRAQASGDARLEASARCALGALASLDGDQGSARAHFEIGLQMLEGLDDPIELAKALCLAGEAEHRTGACDRAADCLRRAQILVAAQGHHSDELRGALSRLTGLVAGPP